MKTKELIENMKCAICGKEIEEEHYYIDVTPNNYYDYRLYFHWECVDDVLMEKVDEMDWSDDEWQTLKKSKNIDCQLLFISDVIDIAPSDKALLESNKDKLNKFGYEIDFLSEEKAIFRKIPQILSKISPKDIMSDILENISGDLDNIEEQILITTSCKAAVKANTYLNQYQMEEIIKNWRTCENPETCPHGRPISKLLSHKEIAGFFQRNK